MSDLVTTRSPSGRMTRTVRRRQPLKCYAQHSPFVEQDPFGQRQLAGVGLIPLAAAAGGALKVVSSIPIIGKLFGSKPSAHTKLMQQKAADTGSGQQVFREYKTMAGQLPGRELGLDTMRLIWQGAVAEGLFQTRGKPKPEWAQDAVYGCAKCGKNTVADVVPQAIQAGVLDPRHMLEKYFIPLQEKLAKDKWAIPSTALERQIVIDALDAKLASMKPDAPVFYGAQPAPPPMSAPVASAPAPVTVSPSVSIPSPVANAPAVSTSVTPAQSTAAAVIPSNVDALIQHMLASGASQQQAFLAAMDQLRSSGTAITPAVQQAVAADVAQAGAAGAMPDWMKYVGIGAGALVLVFALARPKRGRS